MESKLQPQMIINKEIKEDGSEKKKIMHDERL